MCLEPIVAGRLWHARQQVRIGPLSISTRMTVLRLSDDTLWVHSPIAPSLSLVAALARLGEVRSVVAPNNSHSRFFEAFLAAFPTARGYISKSLAAKHPHLDTVAEAADLSRLWPDDLEGWFIEGLPQLDETVWFHRETRSLIMADLLFRIDAPRLSFKRLLARVAGVDRRLAMSRTLRLLVRDEMALSRSVAPLLSLQLDRILVAHEEIVEDHASARLAAAFEWLPSLP